MSKNSSKKVTGKWRRVAGHDPAVQKALDITEDFNFWCKECKGLCNKECDNCVRCGTDVKEINVEQHERRLWEYRQLTDK